MPDWLLDLQSMRDRHMACALITLVQAKGSTPRDVGAKMVVTQDDCRGSIGGGALEFEMIEQARRILNSGGSEKRMQSLQTLQLGADAGQCCGGVCTVFLETFLPSDRAWLNRLMETRDYEHSVLVTSLEEREPSENDRRMVIAENHVEGHVAGDQETVMRVARTLLQNDRSGPDRQVLYRQSGDKTPAYFLEVYGPNNNFRVMLFGAGHVGKAIIRVMSGLPCHVTWVDARPDLFPASIPNNVERVVSESYERIIAGAQPGTFFLVMTHSHPLDRELCEYILKRRDFGYLGLIGSKTKRERFVTRLLQRGLRQEDLNRLTCPIGIPEIPGKYPGAIAVAVAAQILQQRGIMKTMSLKTGTL